MPKYYFLSRFTGTGTQRDPFRPLTAKLGTCGMLDLRPDETRQEGWCFTCLNSEHGINLEHSSELIYLGENAHGDLGDSTLRQIKDTLGISFKSTTLAELIVEILLFRLMPGRGLRPGLDGRYTVHLNGPLWQTTESEAYEFVGRLREPEVLKIFPNDTPPEPSDIRPVLDESLIHLASIVDHGRPGWLVKEIEKVKQKRSDNPLVTNYIEAKELYEASDLLHIHKSSAVLWILMLAHDLRLTSEILNVRSLSPRFRSASDCEPTKYELYVMARYIEAGIEVEKTDSHRTGEFRTLSSGQSVHVECKYKSISSMGPRRVREVFDSADARLKEILSVNNARVFIQISCRTDPTSEDLTPLIECISRALERDISEDGLELECGGKFTISLLPGAVLTDDSGIQLPAGIDYGFVESTLKADSTGIPRPIPAWGVAWRVIRPGGWIRSVVDSVRKAASQVPGDSSNLIYVHVPSGKLGAVHTRIDSVAPAIEELFSSQDRYTRVNTVILTGQAALESSPTPKTLTNRYIYKAVNNHTPRNALPPNFRVFGRDFTRKPS